MIRTVTKKLHVPEQLQYIQAAVPRPLFIVGGYCRNLFIGDFPTDIDLAGAYSSRELKALLPYPVVTVQKDLDTCIITADGCKFEYTPLRKERYAPGGAHTPEAVEFTGDVYEDSLRRDFTCNSIYYDLQSHRFIDYHGGIEDTKSGILRAVDPVLTFQSDGLRLMRLCRLAAETGFKIDPATMRSAQLMIENLEHISKERIRVELDKILSADDKYGIADAHYRGLKLMYEIGAFKYVFPQLLKGVGLNTRPEFHDYDVFEHSLQTVRNSPTAVRLAALLHDVGKPVCEENAKNTHDHHIVGEEIVRDVLGQNGLKYPNETVTRTARLVKNHMYNLRGDAKPNKIKLFIAENEDIIEDLEALIRADGLSCGKGYVPKEKFLGVHRYMIENCIPFKVKDLKINGNDILAIEKIDGKLVGSLLNDIFRECLFENIRNNRDELLEYARKRISGQTLKR